MFKRNSKQLKHQLKHLNEIYPIFYKNAIEKLPDESEKAINSYIEILLKKYLESEHIITKEQIEQFKQFKQFNSNEAK